MRSEDVVVDYVARVYGVPRAVIEGPGRPARVVEPRFVAMYVCRELGMSLERAAGAVRRRDHTTAMNACRRVAGWIEVYPAVRERVKGIVAGVKRRGLRVEG